MRIRRYSLSRIEVIIVEILRTYDSKSVSPSGVPVDDPKICTSFIRHSTHMISGCRSRAYDSEIRHL